MTDLELTISKLDKPHDRVLTLLRAVPESYLSTACICRLCMLSDREIVTVLADLLSFARIVPFAPCVPVSKNYWSIA